MIRFNATLWLWSGANASWHFITIPEGFSAEIRAQSFAQRGGFGSVRVQATVREVAWRTSVFPQKTGGYILPVKAEVRRQAEIAAGDEVELSLELLEC